MADCGLRMADLGVRQRMVEREQAEDLVKQSIGW